MDDYLGTSPWLLIAMTAIAFVGAFVRLVRWARFFGRRRDGSGSEKGMAGCFGAAAIGVTGVIVGTPLCAAGLVVLLVRQFM